MLINLSNHPSSRWGAKQKEVANQTYGKIIDIPFPRVQPEATSEDINTHAQVYIDQIVAYSNKSDGFPFAVHIMGEMTFTYRVVAVLEQFDITCVASTTFRDTIEHPDGSKTTNFNFIQFRPYR